MTHDSDDPQDESRREGRYANYFQLAYNALEFVLEFGQYYGENEDIRFHTRIVTSSTYAKAFLTTFQKSLEQYEDAFGTIPKLEE